jgi:hypothetical protein
MDQHSSLYQTFVNYSRKKFYNIRLSGYWKNKEVHFDSANGGSLVVGALKFVIKNEQEWNPD